MFEFLKSLKDAAPAAGAIITAVSALVALSVFIYTRKMNRRRATFDMVLKTFVDDAGQRRYADFKTVMARHKDPTDALDIMPFADPACPPSPERQIVRSQVNEYELISLGIRRKLFDETLYKMWFQDQFQRDFESLEDFIKKTQTKRPSVFCEYSKLYHKWKKSPHPENSPGMMKQIYWVVTRNHAKLKKLGDHK